MRGKRSKSQLLKLSMEANLHYQLSYRLSAIDFLERPSLLEKPQLQSLDTFLPYFHCYFCWVSGYEDGYASYRQ